VVSDNHWNGSIPQPLPPYGPWHAVYYSIGNQSPLGREKLQANQSGVLAGQSEGEYLQALANQSD